MRQEIDSCLLLFFHETEFSFHAELIELQVWSITIYSRKSGILGYVIHTPDHTLGELISEVSKIPEVKELVLERKLHELLK